MKKNIVILVILLCNQQVFGFSSSMTIRPLSTSPLYYTMIDYSKKQIFMEALPFYVGMYDSNHINQNLILEGKTALIFNQQGKGDLNPTWLNLASNNDTSYYHSKVTFTPRQTQAGIFLHYYEEYKKIFIDVRTALVTATTQIFITEQGGKNGNYQNITNAYQAFTQESWNYGKIGNSNHQTGLSNIQVLLGSSNQFGKKSESFDIFLSGFAVIEIPSGSNATSEWLFPATVGTNHWGLGFGAESLMCSDGGMKFMIGGNYRYLLPAWETRSFDLTDNGQWSRYLSVQNLYGLPTAPETLGLPGINFFTQPAEIKGRNQLNIYVRTEQQIGRCAFELSYNFFYTQQESIGKINNIIPGYGIYALTGPAGGTGGITTASKALINQDTPKLDPVGQSIELTTAMLDKNSATAKTYATNTLNFDIQRVEDTYIYGFGSSIEVAQSLGGISSWSIWLKFEYLLDNSLRN